MKKMTDKRKKEILKLINDLYFEFGTKNPLRLCKGLGIEVVSANIEMKGLYTEVFSSKLIIIQKSIKSSKCLQIARLIKIIKNSVSISRHRN